MLSACVGVWNSSVLSLSFMPEAGRSIHQPRSVLETTIDSTRSYSGFFANANHVTAELLWVTFTNSILPNWGWGARYSAPYMVRLRWRGPIQSRPSPSFRVPSRTSNGQEAQEFGRYRPSTDVISKSCCWLPVCLLILLSHLLIQQRRRWARQRPSAEKVLR